MATLEAFLKRLPRDEALNLRAGTLLRLLEEDRAEAPREILTTDQATELYGYSKPTWAKWAAEGKIWADVNGQKLEAWHDGEGGPWRLPRRAIDAHIARQRDNATRTRGRRRGPRNPKAALR